MGFMNGEAQDVAVPESPSERQVESKLVIPADKRDSRGRFLPGVPKADNWTDDDGMPRIGGLAKATKRQLMAEKIDERVLTVAVLEDPTVKDADDAWAALGASAYVASKATMEGGGDLRQAVMAGKFALEMADRQAERGADAAAVGATITVTLSPAVAERLMERMRG